MPDNRRTPSRAHGRTGPGRVGATTRVGPRPAATAATGPAPAPPRRRPRLTGRAAVLVMVLSLLTISYASSMRAYLEQRDHIGTVQAQIALREAQINDLEREKRRWDDPAYVRQKARELNYVMPGETAYVVLDENGKPLDSAASLTDPTSIDRKAPRAWWSTAWRSVQLAGNPPKAEPPPATKITDHLGG